MLFFFCNAYYTLFFRVLCSTTLFFVLFFCISFIFNPHFFIKCIVSSLSFSFFLFCVKMSDWIVGNVSRVLYTFVNSVIVN